MQFEVYRDDDGGWRWRLVGRFGRRLAESAEAFADKAECVVAIGAVKVALQAPVQELG